MSGAYSISVTGDDHAENHSRRAYTPSNAERSLQSENIVILDCGNDRVAFNDFFRQSILDYNAKQKRDDRKKSLDYLQALEAGTEGYGRGEKQEKPFYHHVLQIGNNQTLGVTTDEFDFDQWKQLKKDGKYDEAAAYVKKHLNRSEDRKQMTAVLEEVGRGLQAKYPYCKFWGITIHQDEPNGTSHMDIRYTIFTDGEKTGLGKRVSMNKGLAKMGFKSDRERTALQKFQDAIKADIQAGMEARGYEREFMDNHEKHVSTSVFQAQKDKEDAIAKKEEAEAFAKEILDEASDKIFEADAREEDANKKVQHAKEIEELHKKRGDELFKSNIHLAATNVSLREENEALEKSIQEQKELKEQNDASRQIIEETFRAVVRFMRGFGHEDDEVEVPETNVSIAETLQAEMMAWQERIQEQIARERQVMFGEMTKMFEQIKKSADRDLSRKKFMEDTKDKVSGRSMEDIYQESVAAMREHDEGVVKEAERIANIASNDKSREVEGKQ